jgi:hypothetical protein
MNQFEKLIELIINEETEKASELFHQIVVEKSREIYENIIDETDFEEEVHDDNQVEDLVNDIEVDKEGLPEADDEMDMDDMGDEEGADDEMDMDDMGDEEGADDEMPDMGDDEGDIEDRVMDLETALGELEAEFKALMAGEEGGDEGGMDDMGDMGGDDDMVREYVEKVGNDWDKNGNQGEGKAVGAKSDSVTGATNTKSIVAGKNDMGGSSANIAKGGSEQAPDGTSPKGKAGGFLKNPQEIDVAKRNVNKPGGNKGAQNYFSKKETSYEKNKGAEGQTTDGKLPVNPKALQGGKVR